MKTWVALSGVISLALASSAQNYNAAINLAHKAVNKTEAAANADPDAQAQAGMARPQPAQPMDPALAATLQNIASLRADLNYLSTNSTPPAALTNHLAAAAGGTKASAETVAKLIGDLATAVHGKPALKRHFQKFAQYLHAAANGSHLTPPQFGMISESLEQILASNGVPFADSQAVLDDLKQLARETK